MVMESYGAVQKKLRAKAHVSQLEVADELNKDQAAISKWESKDTQRRKQVAAPTRDDVIRIGNLLKNKGREHGVTDGVTDELLQAWESEYENVPAISANKQSQSQIDRLIADAPEQDKDAFIWSLGKFLGLWEKLWLTRKDFLNYSKFNFDLMVNLYDGLFAAADSPVNMLQVKILLARGIQKGYNGDIKGSEIDLLTGLSTLRGLKEKNPNTETTREERIILLELGDLFRRMDATRWKEARNYYFEAKALPFSEPSVEAGILRRIGSTFLFGGDPKSSEKYCNESLDSANDSINEHAKRKGYEHVAWVMATKGQFQQALDKQEKAHLIAQGIDNLHEKELAKSYRYLGDYLRMANRFDESEKNYLLAIDAVKETQEKMRDGAVEKEKVLMGWIRLGLGAVYLENSSKLVLAETNLKDSISIAQQLSDSVALAWSFLYMGQLNFLRGQKSAAESYYEAIKSTEMKIGETHIGDSAFSNPYIISTLYINEALLAMANKDTKKIKTKLRAAIESAKTYELWKQYCEALHLLGLLNCRHRKTVEQGISNYFDSLELAHNTDPILFEIASNWFFNDLSTIDKETPGIVSELLKRCRNWESDFSRPKARIQHGEALLDKIIRFESSRLI